LLALIVKPPPSSVKPSGTVNGCVVEQFAVRVIVVPTVVVLGAQAVVIGTSAAAGDADTNATDTLASRTTTTTPTRGTPPSADPKRRKPPGRSLERLVAIAAPPLTRTVQPGTLHPFQPLGPTMLHAANRGGSNGTLV
jgi:hypothetical protein